ncbi:hypothetical protein EVAR_64589_1 [Eumeta japonica]|uniref:Ig-like domain-containing protein n=1 Tax=Eumeta variegata TaxID=151549 RepID=A0A4C1Z1V1_EUMVA|nr:hypothetical protein EVAR_64589_1 [Eumeta japonica]
MRITEPPTRIFNTTSVGATHGSCNEYSCTISVQLPHRYTARLAYTCEVSTEGPRFAVVKQTKTMTIAATLAERPVITGAPASAHPGEKLQLNCSTGYAMPPANIAWYIDGKLIEPDLSIGERTVTSVPDDFGRRTSWRANQLRVTTLRTTIHVRCVATQPMDPPYIIDANATIIVPKSPHLSMFTASNGDVSKMDTRCSQLVALALVIHRLCKSSAFSDRDAD